MKLYRFCRIHRLHRIHALLLLPCLKSLYVPCPRTSSYPRCPNSLTNELSSPSNRYDGKNCRPTSRYPVLPCHYRDLRFLNARSHHQPLRGRQQRNASCCLRTPHPPRKSMNLHSYHHHPYDRSTFLFSSLFAGCTDRSESHCESDWTPMILILRNNGHGFCT